MHLQLHNCLILLKNGTTCLEMGRFANSKMELDTIYLENLKIHFCHWEPKRCLYSRINPFLKRHLMSQHLCLEKDDLH